MTHLDPTGELLSRTEGWIESEGCGPHGYHPPPLAPGSTLDIALIAAGRLVEAEIERRRRWDAEQAARLEREDGQDAGGWVRDRIAERLPA